MKEIYYYILDFKDIHPIRFWFFISGFIMLLIMSITVLWLVINKLIRNKRERTINKLEKKREILGDNDVIETLRDNYEEETLRANDEFIKPNTKQEKKKTKNNSKLLIGVVASQITILIVLLGIFFIQDKSACNKHENISVSSSKYIFGIDVSHYQGKIDWAEVRTSHHPIKFVFIRATMGDDGVDRYFKRNWKYAKKYNYLRGAYHYYRPNENSTRQFENFKSRVKLEKGDFYPVLDIEKESRFGRANLRKGVINWLKLAEKEYGVKPIIYTGLKFYQHILKGHVDGYPLWIAAYSGKHRLKNVEWTFHQFTEKVRVKGIRSTVDGNDFKGELIQMDKLRITNANK